MERSRISTVHIQENTKEASEEGDDDHEQYQISSPSITDLPSDILMNILSRLSVKTIFTCRYICKTWLNLLLDPLFAKLHFTRAPTCHLVRNTSNKRISSLYLVELERDSTCDIVHRSCNIKNCFRKYGGHVNMKLSTKFSLPKRGEAKVKNSNKSRIIDRKFHIVNSCNGLLCLCGGCSDPVVIYNPVAGEYITLPKHKHYYSRVVCGLGFSLKTNQYKVLQMFCPRIWDPIQGKYLFSEVAEIHTIGSGSWRRIGHHEFDWRSSCPTFLNGALHWISDDHESYDFIVSFDFEEEQFRAITPPLPYFSLDPIKEISKISMGVLRGCLYICDSSCDDSIDLWVMKDYGVKESWTKEFEIKTTGNDRWPACFYEPIDFLNNGDMLMYHMNNALISYNGIGFKYFKICETQSKFQAIAHIPSFVSLKDMMGDNVEVLNVRSRFANVEPKEEITEAPVLVEEILPEFWWKKDYPSD